jgi:glycine hydroxymethyltransferase
MTVYDLPATALRWTPKPALIEMLRAERAYQQETLCLIASRSIIHPAVLSATRSIFANVTTEGYPGRRYHSGCRNSDAVEEEATASARNLFGAAFANVQCHSASVANLAVITAILEPGDTLLSMELASGGHLTHGNYPSVTGRYFRPVHYGLDASGRIDLGEVERLARQHKPKIIVSGASAYSREIDFAGFRRIADQQNCLLLADISHTAGLVAAGLYPSPVPHAHITTLCTHKQLFGPKGGLIMSGPDADMPFPGGKGTLAEFIDRAVFPHFQGSPDMGAIAGKAYALNWAASSEFRDLMMRVRVLANLLAETLADDFSVVSGGTDSHLVLVDLRPDRVTGQQAEIALEDAGILTNRNRVPGDTAPARVTSGLRLGTNIAAFRGLSAGDFQRCCALTAEVLKRLASTPLEAAALAARIRVEIREIMSAYPLRHPLELPC